MCRGARSYSSTATHLSLRSSDSSPNEVLTAGRTIAFWRLPGLTSTISPHYAHQSSSQFRTENYAMPLYEYECRGCGHHFEALVRNSLTPGCPECNSQNLQRLPSLFAVDSDQTRKLALQAGRKHAARAQRDKTIADREAMEHDHH